LNFTLDNYKAVFSKLDFIRVTFNSLFLAVIRVVVVLYTSAIAAYVLEKMEFKGKHLLFAAILSTMMIPWTVTLVPKYQLMSWFKWLNSYNALIIPFLFDTFGIFMLKQFLNGIPDYFVEAGRIDGASEFYIFHRLVLPQMKGGLASLGILKALDCWNDFMWPYLVLNRPEKFTLPIALKSLSNSYWNDFSWMLTGITISMIPVVILYLFFKDKLIEGMAFAGTAN
jgi:ABC-type glycerol-3-phosphate transport system permease component